jgi:uncharacterized protein (DUF488 family)
MFEAGSSPEDVPASTNAFWQNESFHNYADYAIGEGFRLALGRLRQLGHSERCAIMCAETLWWQCHRRIISDYLIAVHNRQRRNGRISVPQKAGLGIDPDANVIHDYLRV